MAERSAVTIAGTLEVLLGEKKYSTIRDILVTMNPADVAGVFEELEDEKVIPLLFRLLPKDQAAEAFVEMEPEHQELLIKGFSDSELKEVLDELYVDDAVDIVEEMPANVVRRILAAAAPAMRRDINGILRYPEDSAGSIMTTEYVSLRPAMTVGEAILRIRRTGVDKETIYTCYVTKDRYLMGLVSVKDLLLAQDDETLISVPLYYWAGHPAYLIGDGNDDGRANMQDRVLLTRYLANWEGVEQEIKKMDAFDINSDGEINSRDRVIFSRYLARWGGTYNSYFNQ